MLIHYRIFLRIDRIPVKFYCSSAACRGADPDPQQNQVQSTAGSSFQPVPEAMPSFQSPQVPQQSNRQRFKTRGKRFKKRSNSSSSISVSSGGSGSGGGVTFGHCGGRHMTSQCHGVQGLCHNCGQPGHFARVSDWRTVFGSVAARCSDLSLACLRELPRARSETMSFEVLVSNGVARGNAVSYRVFRFDTITLDWYCSSEPYFRRLSSFYAAVWRKIGRVELVFSRAFDLYQFGD
ncbi:hypothetical protein F511_18013 [Dorcoceras hygrometricum]|uniref:CCHC-type domain-containing protein n=1 Tax=Dorcoceras hygrometricum TaxID=472368 RepID=A0A2Z7AKM3_9LAMI|nr:hypothetical protein F511_18013 [Dorcoceras hygrometricum]